MTIAFDVEKIKKLVEDARAGRTGQPLGDSRYAYPPHGIHVVKFFVDPDSEILRRVDVHRKKNDRVLCPRSLDETNDCLLCQVSMQTKNWRLGARTSVLIYAQLLETNAHSDYWKPGAPYLLVGNQLLYKALINFLQSIRETDWQQNLDPTLCGPYVRLTISQTGITITQTGENIRKPIINERKPQWWLPLSQTWVSSTFEHNDYKIILRSVLQEYGKTISDTKLLDEIKQEVGEQKTD